MKCLPALFLLALARAAHAQNLGVDWLERVGRERAQALDRPFAWSATAGARGYYLSNVFRSASEESDVLLQGYVGGSIRRWTEDNQQGLWLISDYNYFLDEDDARDDEHRAYGYAQWKGRTVTVVVSDIARLESDPVEGQIVERLERFQNEARLFFQQRLGERLSLDLNLFHTYVNFRRDDFDPADNSSYGATLAFGYQHTEDVRFVLEAEYSRIDYRRDVLEDSDGFGVRVGAVGDFTERLKGAARIGYGHRESDSSDASGPEFFGDLSYRLSDRTSLSLSGRRVTTYSVAGDFQVTTAGRLVFSHDVLERVNARAEATYERATVVGAADRAVLVLRAGATWQCTPSLHFEGSYIFRSTFAEEAPDFDEHIVLIGASYSFP